MHKTKKLDKLRKQRNKLLKELIEVNKKLRDLGEPELV